MSVLLLEKLSTILQPHKSAEQICMNFLFNACGRNVYKGSDLQLARTWKIPDAYRITWYDLFVADNYEKCNFYREWIACSLHREVHDW